MSQAQQSVPEKSPSKNQSRSRLVSSEFAFDSLAGLVGQSQARARVSAIDQPCQPSKFASHEPELSEIAAACRAIDQMRSQDDRFQQAQRTGRAIPRPLESYLRKACWRKAQGGLEKGHGRKYLTGHDRVNFFVRSPYHRDSRHPRKRNGRHGGGTRRNWRVIYPELTEPHLPPGRPVRGG